MKWNIKILLKIYSVVQISLFTIVPSIFAQVGLVHTPVFFAEADKPIELVVRVDGGVSTSGEMRIYYRHQTEESYDYMIMQNFGEEFRGEIPAQSIANQRVQYFISYILDGNIITLPENNPFYDPYEIQITPSQKQEEVVREKQVQTAKGSKGQSVESNQYLILSPENGEQVRSDEVVIAVSLFFADGEIDVYQSRLLVDGRRVSPELSENLISYVPSRMSEGEHEIDLYFVDKAGKMYDPIRWRFFVIRSEKQVVQQRPLLTRTSGNIYVESKTEKYSGNRLDNHQIGGQLRTKQGPLGLGTSFYITSLENERYQPRDRFLFWLDAKLLKLYAGDTSPHFSELMLWGKRVRGFNAQLNLKLINFDFVMGQTYRRVNTEYSKDFVLDPVSNDTLFIDPVSGDTVKTNTGVYLKQDVVQRYGTFQQDLMGLRTSFGSGRNFQWGLSLLKVKDDVHSIENGLNPKDNLVLGSDLLFAFFRNHFRWKSEVALSFLTNDISPGALSKSDIDSLLNEDIPFDPSDYEKYLVINTSTIPLDPTKLSSLAYTSTLQLNMLWNAITVKYKSIGAAYNSLGNPFVRKNIRGLFMNDRIRLFRNRVYLTLGYEKYDDNFTEEDNRPVLNLETLQGGLNIFPGAGLPAINVSYRNYRRNNHITEIGNNQIDNREDNRTQEVSVNANYDLNMFQATHTLSINYIKLDKTDAFAGSRLNMLPIGINNDIQSFSLQSRYQIPLKTTISYASNENSYLGGMNLFKFKTVDLKAEYRLLRDKLFLYGGFRRFDASGGDNSSTGTSQTTIIDYSKNQFNFGGRFAVLKNHFLVLDVMNIDFSDNGGYFDNAGQFISNPSYKDYSIRFRYEMQF